LYDAVKDFGWMWWGFSCRFWHCI